MNRATLFFVCGGLWLASAGCGGSGQSPALQPGARTLLDAHNCYPYHGQWSDRIDRALAQELPLAIEQDLRWYVDPSTGEGHSVVAHNPPVTGDEPTLRDYFFERIRPIIEDELSQGDPARWPVITLNLDFKTEEDEHLAYIWDLLGEYEDWLVTAPNTDNLSPFEAGPLLVLTGDSDRQARVFHGDVPTRGALRLFGAARLDTPRADVRASTRPSEIVAGRATSYRRWWNNPWSFVEEGGQPNAGEWTADDEARLEALVDHAHERGLWIRFYTLNGSSSNGWSAGYDFGSLEAARRRWDAAIRARVDFIATDQYEDLHRALAEESGR